MPCGSARKLDIPVSKSLAVMEGTGAERGPSSAPLRWPAGIVSLATGEFSRLLRSPFALYLFLGFAAFLGFAFWLFATYSVQIFLDVAYLILPLFLLAPAAASISWDRQTGFAGVLFTCPITAVRYYLGKFLSLLLVFGLYLLALFPFDLLVVYYAGPGWVEEIGPRILWGLLETAFAAALGLLLSASFGKRGALPSTFLGFATALAMVAGPVAVPSYLAGLDRGTSNLVLALLHYSPLMAAMDNLGLLNLAVGSPLLSLVVSASVTVALFLLGLAIYTKAQSAEGWEVRRPVASALVAVALAVLVLTPLAPPYGYAGAPVSEATGNCTPPSALQYCLFPPPGAMEDWGVLPLGSSKPLVFRFEILNQGSFAVRIGDLWVEWSSQYFSFNRTSASLGPVTVPPSPAPNQIGTAAFDIPVTVTASRAIALGGTHFPGLSTPVLFKIRADGAEVVADLSGLRGSGPTYNRDTAWAVAGGMAVAALGLRFVGRRRKIGR